MNKILLALIALSLTYSSCKTVDKPSVVNSEVLSSALKEKTNKPKNVIFLIGDGMGLAQITAGMYSNGNKTSLENFKVLGLHKSHASNKLVTDSAAAATSFACGVKTYNGAIGVDKDTLPVKSIFEFAKEKNFNTGLVASSTIVHATPASFFSHNKYRKNYEEIAADLVDADVDVFIGGGKKYFDRRDFDDRNLLEEFAAKDYNISHFAEKDITDFTIDVSKNFGYLTSDTDPLQVSQGRDYMIPASKFAMDYLTQKSTEDGFMLMIEGSQIDWGGHANISDYIVSEFIEFDEIIQLAYDYAKADGNTLVVVTADHETGGYAIQQESTMDSLVTAFTSTYHTAVMIPVFAYGPGAEEFAGIMENTDIFHKMKKLIIDTEID